MVRKKFSSENTRRISTAEIPNKKPVRFPYPPEVKPRDYNYSQVLFGYMVRLGMHWSYDKGEVPNDLLEKLGRVCIELAPLAYPDPNYPNRYPWDRISKAEIWRQAENAVRRIEEEFDPKFKTMVQKMASEAGKRSKRRPVIDPARLLDDDLKNLSKREQARALGVSEPTIANYRRKNRQLAELVAQLEAPVTEEEVLAERWDMLTGELLNDDDADRARYYDDLFAELDRIPPYKTSSGSDGL